MYSKEERETAILLYIKYDKCAADVIRELGYPDRKTLAGWYKTYLETGELFNRCSLRPKYSLEQKKAAVEHYLEHGCNLSRSVKALGYPSRETLRLWCNELMPGRHKRRTGGMRLARDQKKEAVMELCTRTGTAIEVAKNMALSGKRYIIGGKNCFPEVETQQWLIKQINAFLMRVICF